MADKLAQAAQIPLQSFTLPTVPPEAAALQALTLTCDIKPDEYAALLTQPFTVPVLPQSITSLTLELFSLGYPDGFLPALSTALPNLKDLTLYSQVIPATSPEASDSSAQFFENIRSHIQELHLLDVFAPRGFFHRAGKLLSTSQSSEKPELRFLEINYTYRHEDPEFFQLIPHAEDLAQLIGPSLVTCAINISPPIETDDPQDPSNLDAEGNEYKKKPQGVDALPHVLSEILVDKLVGEDTSPKGLLLLNTTLYTLRLDQLVKVLERHDGLMVLNATIYLEPTEEHRSGILSALGGCPSLEQVELVGNPSLDLYHVMAAANPQASALESILPSLDDIKTLGGKCPKLESFKFNVLRTNRLGYAEWVKEGGEWKGGFVGPGDPDEQHAGQKGNEKEKDGLKA
ncbi:hypothetical protein MMC24_003636 [Lignoscripta atroalba]|nr:hypothetical protein [Lignoscripta atroalba]